MFSDCRLDSFSVQRIAEHINSVSNNAYLHIGIQTHSNIEYYQPHFNTIREKGWNLFVSDYYGIISSDYYGAVAASTMPLNEISESEMFAPKPYWAKPYNTSENNARYVDSNGNFYDILGGHYIYVDDPDTYGMFTSEEDAAANMRLTKIVK
jgi:hypothetical protein